MEIFQFGDSVIFCKDCGQIAGGATKCPVNYGGQHRFVTRPAGIYICRYCGASIGRGTKCPVNYGGFHKFERVTE